MSPFCARITLPKPLWYSTGLILLFNGLLFAWLLININNQVLLASVDYWAQTIGPLLMLPLWFSRSREIVAKMYLWPGRSTAGPAGQAFGPYPLRPESAWLHRWTRHLDVHSHRSFALITNGGMATATLISW